MTHIRKLLIANRGEIACRIIRTAKARGIVCVAVFSEADVGALHVGLADEALCIGGSEPAHSYLNIDAVIHAAKESGADAIHPGYGFLSERADFARACTDAGLIFVGPPADAIAAMGDKAESKRRMIAAGVPCVPGYQGNDQTDSVLLAEAEKIGFPVMVKASAGGGGRGMRIVQSSDAIAQAIVSARKEALSAFGDGRLLLERAVIGARHVEIQIFADSHGQCIHLGERDCSLQRRNQKVIEEAPSPVISPEKRAEMGATAIRAAKAVGYIGAGTVEFLYEPLRDEFYFLEMNTRIQVEHPVTEMITGLDLVAVQFDVAEGNPLSVGQDDIRLDGWAMEARLYAEDPAQGFMPSSGKIAVAEFPNSPNVRVDTGVEQGHDVASFYDPMIAKVIAHGETRDEARRKLATALRTVHLLGIAHNRDFLISLLEDAVFENGDADTNFIESNVERLSSRKPPGGSAAIALVGAALIDRPFDDLLTGWHSRGEAGFPLHLVSSRQETIKAQIGVNGTSVTAEMDNTQATIEIISKSESTIRYRHQEEIGEVRFSRIGDQVEIESVDGWERYIDLTLAPVRSADASDDTVKAPTAGLVTGILVTPGDNVERGTILATVEAMKMEHQLKSPRSGKIAKVLVRKGDQVAIRAKLILLETETT